MNVAGLLTPIEHALRHVLDWLHGTVGLPWAWSIVALTVIVRMLIVPLAVRQIHSMQNLQRHAPQMKEIQRKYKQDKQRQQQELMKFYKENNINPAASCLPLLAQAPVFFALYFVLRNFSRHPPCPGHPGKFANFCVKRGDFSWLGHHFVPNIADHVTQHWSGYLLLVIYAATQTASTLLMATTMDKTQRTILLIFPLFILFVVSRFPTGLLVYWVTTNLWTVGQGVITRRLVPRNAPPPPKRSSRTPPRGEKPSADDGAKPAAEQPKAAPARQAPRKVKKKKKRARR